MAHGKRGGKVGYQMVALGANSAGNGWAQYAEGILSYSNINNVEMIGAEHLLGDGLQYFSDRTELCRNPSNLKWFAKSKADKMNLSISMGGFVSGNACRTPVTIMLVTWGNAKYTYCPSCYGKNMYLLDNGMLITFKKL